MAACASTSVPSCGMRVVVEARGRRIQPDSATSQRMKVVERTLAACSGTRQASRNTTYTQTPANRSPIREPGTDGVMPPTQAAEPVHVASCAVAVSDPPIL